MAFTQNAIDNTFAAANLTGTVSTSQIAGNAVTYAKIQQTTGTSVLIGNPTGSAANVEEITLGTNLSFSGTTLNCTASSSLPITVITGATQAAAVNNLYVSNYTGGVCVITLPSTAAIGSVIQVYGLGSGGWQIAQNASQLIHFGSQVTTTGTGGSLSSSNQYDGITIVCVVANTTWLVQFAIGNISGV